MSCAESDGLLVSVPELEARRRGSAGSERQGQGERETERHRDTERKEREKRERDSESLEDSIPKYTFSLRVSTDGSQAEHTPRALVFGLAVLDPPHGHSSAGASLGPGPAIHAPALGSLPVPRHWVWNGRNVLNRENTSNSR